MSEIKNLFTDQIQPSDVPKLEKNSDNTVFPEFFKNLQSLSEVKQSADTESIYDNMAYDDKVKLQNKEIDSVERGEKTCETDIEKGNYGEMKTDQDLRSRGCLRISVDMVTNIKQTTHTADVGNVGRQGIDGVYYKENGTPKYIIVESKYGSSQLHDTKDGKQMSDNWIDKRLDKAVGSEKADEIRLEKLLNPDNVGTYISHVDSAANVRYDKLDNNANVTEKDVKL